MRYLKFFAEIVLSRRSRQSSALKDIWNSGIFNANIYRSFYPDLRDVPVDLANHYIEHGASERRNPHPLFDTEFYLNRYPDVRASGINPLLHYIRHGGKERRCPHPLFDADYYLAQLPESLKTDVNPLAHYLTLGWRLGFWPNPLFDPLWYINKYTEVREAGVEPFTHYITTLTLARPENPHPSGEAPFRREEFPPGFDEAPYIAQNPDIGAAIERFEWQSGLSQRRLSGHAKERSPDPQDGQLTTGLALPPAAAAHPLNALPNGFQPSSYARHYPDLHKALGDNPLQLYEHWINHGSVEGRIGFGLRQYEGHHRSQKYWGRRNGITMFGFFDAPSGLGAAARGYRNALIAAGYEVDSVTITLKNNRFETTPDVKIKDERSGPSYDNKINIFHFNADMVQLFFWDGRMHLLDDSYNIGMWVWELAHFRSDWVSCFGAFDEIWAPSEFCRNTFAASSPIPVLTIPYVVEANSPEKIFPKAHFCIPDNTFVFGSIFDVGSVVERKNPDLIVKAFIGAFGNRQDVTLVMKYHSASHYPERIDELHKLASGRSNIVFIGRVFDEKELSSLRLNLDCLVSPHRSEGFGLNIAESMISGRSVIATDYSGNVDFSDETNSHPLNYRLIEVEKDIGPYTQGSLWADPEYDHLVQQMREVADRPDEAVKRVQKAAKDISENYSTSAIAAKIRARFNVLKIFDSPEWTAEKSSPNRRLAYKDVCPGGPKISVVVPVYNIDPIWLRSCVESVRDQFYTNWELILHDDGSDRADTLALLAEYRGIDHRIKISFGERNLGISDATNTAIGLSSGSFIAFLDNDDEISADALEAMAEAILSNVDGDVFYSDEDKIDVNGNFCDHYCKPDWSPEHMESSGYLLHLVVIRRALLLDLGGLRNEFSGAQDFDLTLRATRAARKVVHVPKILYHWRMVPGSAAAVVDAKPIALIRAAKALQNHLDACGRNAVVEPGLLTGLFRVRDYIAKQLPVTLIIPTDNRSAEVQGRGKINLFDNFVESILEKTVTSCEVRLLAVDNGNLSQRQVKFVEQNNGKVISFPGPRSPFSMAKKINFTLPHVETEQIIILNDDMEVISPGWVDALMELSQRPTSGVVGARLLYPDNRIQHCGMIFGINDHVAHMFHQYGLDQIGYNGYTHIIRNYLAVTGACMATKKSLFNEVGGFDEDFAVDYNDTDFCLRVHSAGYRNIYTPFATLYHFEGTTAVRSQPNPREHDLFVKRWKNFMQRDPYYNPNLTKAGYDFSLV